MRLPTIAGVRFRTRRAMDAAVRRRLPARIDPTETLFVLGSPRSGTTWLQEQLAWAPDSLAIFEPFGPRPEGTPFDGTRLQLAGVRAIDPRSAGAVDRWLDDVIAGRVCGPWELRGQDRTAVARARRLIVKSIRLNRSVPWLLQRVTVERVVAIVRDPVAVLESMLGTPHAQWHDWVQRPDLTDASLRWEKISLFAQSWAEESRHLLDELPEDAVLCYEDVVGSPELLGPTFTRLRLHMPSNIEVQASRRSSTGSRRSGRGGLTAEEREMVRDCARRSGLELSPGRRPRVVRS